MRDPDDAFFDDEGNLRPHVARALDRLPGRVPRQARPNGCLGLVLLAVFVILVTVVGIGLTEARGNREQNENAESDCTVLADSVTLRAGPGVDRPPRGRLSQYEAVRVVGRKRGWYQVVRGNGQKAWAYGGYLQWYDGPWHGPGIVRRAFSYGLHGESRYLDEGALVLIERVEGSGWTHVITPDGARVKVPRGTVSEVVSP